jgi:glycine/D-amino acid oxidase-like deaminating enzyme
MHPSIEQSCFWLATRRGYTPSPPLQGDARADVVIVGGGFTGLWTSIFLKELAPDTEVMVLEQAVLGYGGSGRNAGQVSGSIDHSHKLAIAHFGTDEARRMARIGLQNLDELAQFVHERGIACDFERVGQLSVALTPAQVNDARALVAAADELGVDGVRFLSADETRAELNSPLYRAGVSDPGWGTVNPIRLVDGLKREAERLGVKFFERTRVTGFARKATEIRVRTESGTVSGEKVILATDAYTHHIFPKLLRWFIPVYDYVLVSEPLTADQLAAIGWRHRQAIVDFRAFFNYYGLTADNRILWGTSEARYYAPNRVDATCDHSEQHYAALRESFRRHFPRLAPLNWEYAWGGAIASTTRLTPFFGTLEDGHVVYGLGYTGLGVANSRLAGTILAHMTLERPSELLELAMVRKKPFPYPPEPLRKLAVNTVANSLRRVDAGLKPGTFLRVLDALGIGFSS